MVKEEKNSNRFKFLMKLMVPAILGAGIGVWISFSKPNLYTAKAVLISTSSLDGAGLSSNLSGLSRLASLGGVNISAGSGDNSNYALTLLRTNQFLYDFLDESERLPLFLAPEVWNRNTDIIKINSKKYDKNNDVWHKFWDGEMQTLPVEYVGYEFQRNNLHVYFDPLEKTFTIRVTSVSPNLSRESIIGLMAYLNSYVRNRTLTRLKDEIGEFEKALNSENIVAIKEATADAIEAKTREYAFALARKSNYVLTFVEEPSLPYKKSSPKRLLYLVVGGFFGFLLGVAIFVSPSKIFNAFIEKSQI